MRTTLAIDDDVLGAAREIAEAERKSVGEVISSLARKALNSSATGGAVRNGIPLLALQPKGLRVTSDLVKELSEELR